jgi:NAD(P)H-dependent flavin oxidoreductase YrpB (nitropropane dioxygenase family)
LAQPAFAKIDRAVEKGNVEAKDLASYWVGQGVGLIDSVRSTGHVVQEFKEQFGEAILNLNTLLE